MLLSKELKRYSSTPPGVHPVLNLSTNRLPTPSEASLIRSAHARSYSRSEFQHAKDSKQTRDYKKNRSGSTVQCAMFPTIFRQKTSHDLHFPSFPPTMAQAPMPSVVALKSNGGDQWSPPRLLTKRSNQTPCLPDPRVKFDVALYCPHPLLIPLVDQISEKTLFKG